MSTHQVGEIVPLVKQELSTKKKSDVKIGSISFKAITFPVGLEKLVCKYLPWFMVSIVMFHRRSPKSKVQKKF